MANDNPGSVHSGFYFKDHTRLAAEKLPSTARTAVSKDTGPLNVLPTETIYNVFRFLGPEDLIRQRLVSKLFHAIVEDPSLWRALYATAHFPLPPGPFAWQSLQYIQRTLVHAARLARSWTTEPLTLISTKVHIGPRSIEDDRLRWVRGRWVIVSKGMKQLWSHDVETGAECVLWDHGPFSNWAVTSLMASQGHFVYVAVHLGRGRPDDPVKLLQHVVNDDTGKLSRPDMFDVPTWSLPREAYIPRIRVDTGNAAYVYVSLCPVSKPRHSLLFDPRNKRFYKFPRFRTRLELLLNYRGAWLPHLVEVYYTPSHIFVLNRSYLIHGNIGEVEVIQTFAVPDPTSDHPDDDSNAHSQWNSDYKANGSFTSTSASLSTTVQSDDDKRRPAVVEELRLTHEILTRDTGSLWLIPVYHTTDPIAKTTTLRFMHTYAPFHPIPGPEMRVRFGCTDYILPETAPLSDADAANVALPPAFPATANHNNNHPNLNTIVRSAEPVLPIRIAMYDLFSVPGIWRGNMVDVSNDGLVRGICGVGWRHTHQHHLPEHDANANNDPTHEDGYNGAYYHPSTPTGMVHKFTVDARGERGVTSVVVGDPSPPWMGLDPTRHYEYTMDGTRGRMWYIKGDVRENDSTGKPVDRDVIAVVVDFK